VARVASAGPAMSEPPIEVLPIKWLARSEAQFFFSLVSTGRMKLQEARELIAIPEAIRKRLVEAAQRDESLAPLCNEAIELRDLISKKLELLLAREASLERAEGQSEPRCAVPSVPGADDSLFPAAADSSLCT